MLTKKQYELLLLIHNRIQESGVSPSFEEMKEALDLKSKSGIHRLITALEERGFIRRLAHRARALEVVKLPEAMADARSAPQPAGAPKLSVVTGDKDLSAKPERAAAPIETRHTVEIPLIGRIAAGTPIEALQTPLAQIEAPMHMLASGGEHFALEVRGDSMVDAGIHDGDTVVIKRQDTAQNGEIIVALVDEEEATLKRLRRKGASIALEAANPDYETRVYGSERVRVQGRLVGLLRVY